MRWGSLLAAVPVAAVTLLAGCGAPAPAPPVRSGGPTPGPVVPTTGPAPGAAGRCPGHPTPACTGVPPGVKLRTLALNEEGAAYRVTRSGTVLDGVRVPGVLLVHADDVTIRNSQIDGYVINADGDRTFRFTITDSTIGPASGCQTLPGIGQDKYTALRVHVRGHGDGFRASGDDVTIRDSYVNLCSNPGDHSDGIQTYNTGKNLTFHHNTVDQRHAKDITAPIFLTDDQIMNATVTDNLIMGGTYSIQLRNGRGRLVMRDNKLVDGSWVYGPVDSECAKIDWSGNSLVTIDEQYRVTSTVGPLPCAG
ncbi:right-handed parallel beta-helix repeat-containing protein [Streptosporangium nondiastaticum]|uniref:right-handed parallel beta-helix repeat-containing protein n=3 Tax=Streptosporangium nondiastaticum TaxID=35764 RepID=UPI0031F76781